MNANNAVQTNLTIQVAPHPQDPTRMCLITIAVGAIQVSVAADWPSLPKIAQALFDGQKNRPLVEVPRMVVKQ